jgi:hypothetical protein
LYTIVRIKQKKEERESHLQMVPIADVMFLASKPRKILRFFLCDKRIDSLFVRFYFYQNLFLARPKPSTSTSTVKSRLNSDNGASARSRPGAGIPSRNVASTPLSAGK